MNKPTGFTAVSAVAQKISPFSRGHYTAVDSEFLIPFSFTSVSTVAQEKQAILLWTFIAAMLIRSSLFRVLFYSRLLRHRKVSHSTVDISAMLIRDSLFHVMSCSCLLWKKNSKPFYHRHWSSDESGFQVVFCCATEK